VVEWFVVGILRGITEEVF